MASIAGMYGMNQSVGVTPLLRLLTVYDYALSACRHRRHNELSKALDTLNDALDFDHPLAFQLASLYHWCADLAGRGDYEEVGRLLKELRDAWAVGGKALQSSTSPEE